MRRRAQQQLAGALAVGSAILAASSRAGADEVAVVERARLQAGLISEARPAVDRVNDVHADAIPEIALLWNTPTSQLSLTYTFTGVVHSVYASELGHQLALATALQLSSRTTVLLGATASRTTLGNIFLTQPAAGATPGLFPVATTSVVTVGVTQGLAHDLTPRVRLDQQATATGYKTLAPAPPLTSFSATLGGGIERIWPVDAVGLGALVGFSSAHATPPTPDQSFLLYTVGPRWRHDWSPSVTSVVTAGVSRLDSVNRTSDPLWAPAARASVLYKVGDTELTGLVATGFTPNPLTGQMVRADEAAIRGVTPLSLHARVHLEASAGFVRGRLIDRESSAPTQGYDSLLSDVAVLWQATPHVQLFGRYTFVGQRSDTTAASFARDSYLVGVALTSRPVTGGAGGVAGEQAPASAFPQRVDRTDGLHGAPPPPPSENER